MAPPRMKTGNGCVEWNGAELSWSLRLPGDGGRTVSPGGMAAFEHAVEDGALVCRWRGHPLLGPAFTVTTVWRDEGGRLSGSIGWTGGKPGAAVAEVRFPEAAMPAPPDGRVFHSNGHGFVLRIAAAAPAADGTLLRVDVSAMQCSALIGPDRSWYFDTRDTVHYCKAYEYGLADGGARVRYASIHPLPLDGRSGRRYRLPYPVSVGVYKGGWFEATRIYREWALRQTWARRPPVDQRLREIGIWLWNRGKADDVIAPVERLQDDTGVPVALDWYWWHKSGYDTSYPFYWPPREGTPAFKRAVKRLSKRGIFAQVYTNGVAWDMDAEHWTRGGAASVVVKADGQPLACMFNTFARRRLAWMCGGGNAPFRALMRRTVKKLRAAGLPGVYLDMIGCASNVPCHNPTHAHAPGGGAYQVAGYRRMVREIARDNPGLPLCTEEPNEAYMDLFDSTISLSGGIERLSGNAADEPVPAFSAVYHGKTAMFGTYALPDSIPPFDPLWPRRAHWKREKPWHRLHPDQFFLETARTVVWGLQPTVANLRREHIGNPEFSEIYAFIVRTARFYHAHRDFLFDGEMLDPGALRTAEIEVSFLNRFIFTAEGSETVVTKRLPAVLHSLWRAPDGRMGLVLANYSREKREFAFSGSGTEAAGSLPPRSWMLIERSGS